MDQDLQALLDSATVKAGDVDGNDVLLLNLDKGTAPDVWQRLRDACSETGLWPFLANADQDKDYHQPTVWDHLEEGSRQDQTRSAEKILGTLQRAGAVRGEPSDRARGGRSDGTR